MTEALQTKQFIKQWEMSQSRLVHNIQAQQHLEKYKVFSCDL